MKTAVTILVIAVVLVGGGWWFLHSRNNPSGFNAAQMAQTVRSETVHTGELTESVSAPGQIQPKTKVSISARVSARIIELPYPEGSVVTKGNPNATPPVEPSVLIRLDSKDLDAQLRASKAHYAAQKSQIAVSEARIGSQEAQIVSLKVQLADAERDLKRQMELLATKDVSQSTVDTAQAKYDQLAAQLNAQVQSVAADRVNLEVLRHELEAADAQIAQAAESLTYTTITSPIDGIVTKVNSEVGELVVIGTMNNAGTVILEVADLSTMMVKTRIDESNVASVKVGQRAEVRAQAYPKEVFEGVVSSVALDQTQDREEGSTYYKTEILLKNPGRQILSGLTADVEIKTSKHENVITVPSQAVLGRPVDDLPPDIRNKPEVDHTRTQTAVVYRVIDGKAIVTPVTVGPSDLTHTIISGGITPGDKVITGPYRILDSLHHEQMVKEEAAPTTGSSTTPS